MSVPLDRLYNFLHDLCNHDDILIYRFLPHGSKNIHDCGPISLFDNKIKNFSARHIICHDQEPLSRSYYNASNKIMHRLADKKISLYDKMLLIHSEKNSLQVTLFEQEDAIGVYWWSHAVIARDWFRYAELDPVLSKHHTPSQDFLIYNRAWTGTREYRLYFSELVANEGLHTKCLMNFSVTDNDQDYRNHQFTNTDFQIQRQDIEKYYLVNNATACYSADYDANDYATCRVEVVLETLFDDARWHLTEKTLRPIACGKPFLLAATPGSLDYLRSYGFKTFSPWIDESYDKILDPVRRLQSIVESMKKFSALPQEQKNQALVEMQSVCKHNRERFFSSAFFDDIVTEFKTNLQHGLQMLEQYKGQDFRNIVRSLGSTERIGAAFSRQELVEIWKKILNIQ